MSRDKRSAAVAFLQKRKTVWVPPLIRGLGCWGQLVLLGAPGAQGLLGEPWRPLGITPGLCRLPGLSKASTFVEKQSLQHCDEPSQKTLFTQLDNQSFFLCSLLGPRDTREFLKLRDLDLDLDLARVMTPRPGPTPARE